MKILARHLFMNLFKPLVYLLFAFTLLFIIGDLMDNADDFLKAGASPMLMVRYYSLQLPSMIIFIVPICLMLATLYSLSMLTRHSEIVAMRASGVSIYRIVRPYMLMGFFCFLFTAVVNEYTGPKYAYRAHQLLQSKKEASDEVYFENIAYKNPTLGHEWHIVGFDTRTFTMRGVTLRERRPDGSDKTKITAAQGHWLDRRWWFEDGSIQRFDENNNRKGKAETFQTLEMRSLKERPEEFMGEAKDPAHQSSLELWNYIKSHQHLSPESINSDEVDLHHKLTMPFICLISIIIGIPVGAHTGRKGALSGIMMAIGMFFGFYAMQFTMEYLAKQMIILPWVGAWTAIITFHIIGSLMIYRMR
ncbi:LptF/LptG family permease [Pontiellaceae bacterium B12227]|nr:LptF/LptG family permease [Pontiellaceae bacterium B12227]